MKKWILFLALAGVLGSFGAAPAAGLEVVYPADKTAVEKSDYLIIKGGDAPPLDAMVIVINDVASDPIDISSAEYQAAFADRLILQPEFDEGKNRVMVQGYKGGKQVSEVKADLFYRKDPLAPLPEGFVPFVMHTPEREAKCAACHNMAPDKVELAQPDPASNPCGSCHRRMLNRKHVHGPAGAMQCASCHSMKAVGGRKYQVPENGARLCGSCHQQQQAVFDGYKFLHGPVAAGLCMVCHDPHASDFPAQLHEVKNELCLDCHDAVRNQVHVARGIYNKSHPLEGVPDPMHPGQDLGCPSCHQPHGGAGPQFFAGNQVDKFSLCQRCHQK